MTQSRLHTLIVLLLLAASASLAAPVWAGKGSDRQRAEMIYRLSKFVTWPAPDDELTICSLERNGVFRRLHAAQGKQANGRNIRVRIVGAAHTETCEILILDDKMPRRLRQRHGMLTIGRGADLLGAGGMISIEFVDSKLALDVNLKAAKAQGLGISSQVLGLARSVR